MGSDFGRFSKLGNDRTLKSPLTCLDSNARMDVLDALAPYALHRVNYPVTAHVNCPKFPWCSLLARLSGLRPGVSSNLTRVESFTIRSDLFISKKNKPCDGNEVSRKMHKLSTRWSEVKVRRTKVILIMLPVYPSKV